MYHVKLFVRCPKCACVTRVTSVFVKEADAIDAIHTPDNRMYIYCNKCHTELKILPKEIDKNGVYICDGEEIKED